jgi:DNA-binding NtrC family response regulator
MSSHLLIIDDEPIAVKNLAYTLSKCGYQVSTAESGLAGIQALNQQCFDVVLTDLRMAQVDGMGILQHALQRDPDCAVILLTAHASLDSAVEAMKAGAFHYLAKPYRLDEVRSLVANAIKLVQLKRENQQLRLQIPSNLHTDTGLITQNPNMQQLLATARQIAPTDSTVLISGDSGTGKELLARYIHAHSKRAQAPFIAINCGALSEELLANELFGHVKGAYTGATDNRAGLIEAAQHGTLFLDEIGEMSLAMQVKLLRVIQEREVQRLGSTTPIAVDIRLITATHRNLPADVASGRFRQDLFFRLNVIGLHLPPLATRREDIPLLAYYFLRKHSLRMGRNLDSIATQAMTALMDYAYPGNVRELENIIERGVALAQNLELSLQNLPNSLQKNLVITHPLDTPELQTLAEREEHYIKQVLEHSEGNRSKAANILGIDRVSLWRKLKKYGLTED